LLLNEFDYDENGSVLSEALPKVIANFKQNYLEVGQNEIGAVNYPYVYFVPSNTGIASGFDLNNDDKVGTEEGTFDLNNDAFSFGTSPDNMGWYCCRIKKKSTPLTKKSAMSKFNLFNSHLASFSTSPNKRGFLLITQRKSNAFTKINRVYDIRARCLFQIF